MSFFTKPFEKDSSFNTEEVIIQKVPIAEIKPDPTQVRVQFDEDKLKELSDSIKERGVMNPVHVRKVDKNSYIILTGERRYRASKMSKQKFIPCIVHEDNLPESEIKAIQLVENLQRQDLSAIETAKGFQALISHGLGQREIARHLGISEARVSKGIKILKSFPAEWINNIEQQSMCISINELYNIAKLKNKNKRKALYEKLMESVGVKVEEEKEEEKIDTIIKKKNTEIRTDFTEEEMTVVWDHLKKIIRKGKMELCRYMTPKKIQFILDGNDEE